MKAKIIDLANAVYVSFEGLNLDDIIILAHDIAYDLEKGKQNRNTEYLSDDEIKQFLLDVYLHIGNFAPKQIDFSYRLFQKHLSSVLV